MDLNRLFFLRENKELTQKDLANILKVNRVNISNWENGKEIIPLKKLNIYSNYFDVSFDYIVGLSNIKKNTHLKKQLDKKLIGNRLRILRKQHNLTQVELATILNTSHSTISAYESGKTLILTSFAYQICKKFNISLDWLCAKY